MLRMLVTLDTSHFDRSPLKEVAPRNISSISVTLDTSHDPIGPVGPCAQLPTGELSMHASTAFLRCHPDFGVNAATEVGPTGIGPGVSVRDCSKHDKEHECFTTLTKTKIMQLETGVKIASEAMRCTSKHRKQLQNYIRYPLFRQANVN